MRPIKFRAWSPLAREMYKVNSLHFDKEGLSEIVVEVFEVDGIIYSSAVARNLELLQFTGVTDKRGKDIYEGDIIAWAGAYDHKLVVRWIEKGLYFDVPLQWIQDIEIIGNIYEHPELMRKQAQ